MLLWPDCVGNWVNLKSVEAVSRLLWRSSKLTDGKKSKEVVEPSSISLGAPFRPKENSEWLLEEEACNIGASWTACAVVVVVVWLRPVFSLLLMNKDRLVAETRKKIGQVFERLNNRCRNWMMDRMGRIGRTIVSETARLVSGQQGLDEAPDS